MTDEIRKALELVVLKAKQVENSSYFKHVWRNEGLNFKFSFECVDGMLQSNFPEEGDLEAIILTVRMFIQDNDQVSFGSLARLLDSCEVSEEWKYWFKHFRFLLNESLDRNLKLTVNGISYSERDVLNTFVYGFYSHTKPKYLETALAWQSCSDFPIMKFEFHTIVSNLMFTIANLGQLCECELQRTVPSPHETLN